MNFESKTVNYINETSLGKFVNEGETKTATWRKQTHELEYFTSSNITTTKNCNSLKNAKALIKKSGIEQKLVTEEK